MRELADARRIRALMRALGQAASGPGRVYFTGNQAPASTDARQGTRPMPVAAC